LPKKSGVRGLGAVASASYGRPSPSGSEPLAIWELAVGSWLGVGRWALGVGSCPVSSQCAQRRFSRVTSLRSELFFDSQELVVFRPPVGAARRAGLDLAGAGGDGEVGDRRIFGLAGPVRDDARVAGLARHRDGVQGLGHGANLIELD